MCVFVCNITFSVILRILLDIDECELDISGCSQICTNTNGSFVCSCMMGYNLSTVDQRTCLGTIHLHCTTENFDEG